MNRRRIARQEALAEMRAGRFGTTRHRKAVPNPSMLVLIWNHHTCFQFPEPLTRAARKAERAVALAQYWGRDAAQ